ncbi:MAG: hypothetical protein Q7S64_00165 [bacterium]|nr:hypothetical protein [bacterium]
MMIRKRTSVSTKLESVPTHLTPAKPSGRQDTLRTWRVVVPKRYPVYPQFRG